MAATCLVEVIKLHPGHCSTDARGDRLASVTNKVGNREDLGGFFFAVLVSDLKVPRIKKVQYTDGMTTSIHLLDSLYNNQLDWYI